MRRGQGKYRGKIPTIWLMTDERIGRAALLRAIARLPRGSAVIVRHYSLPNAARYTLFDAVVKLARPRGIAVVLAGDPALAHRWGADGHHGRTHYGHAPPRWLHSAPAHDMSELRAAEQAGAHVVLLSPLFATRSHPGAPPLGPFRFAALARAARIPVIALGGVAPRHAALVRSLGASGYAGIDGLLRSRI